jgi:ATP-binding cassette subfamily F protein 3
MEKVERPENAPRTATLSFHRGIESGNDVLTLQNLSKSYGQKKLFAGLSTLVKKKDRLFVLGPNGCGKSTLLKILTGSLLQDEGKYEFGYNVTLGYYDQENQRLNPTDTVLDSLWDEYSDMTMTEIRTALAAFGFSGDDVGKTVSVLSGGERARLTLCRLSLSECNLLILDEPTNHLDIPTREVLEEALLRYDGTLIVVSHDRYLVKKLANRILDFHYPKQGAPLDFMGGYEECLAYGKKYLSGQGEAQSATVAVQSGKEQYLESKRQRSEAKKLERRIKLNAEETEKIETRLAQIEEEEAACATDHVKLMALTEEKESGEGAKKSMKRGMDGITSRVADGVENIRNGVMNGVEGIKNGVVNGIGSVKKDVKRGADNVKDSIMDGTLDTEDATHGIEYGSDMGGNSESESRMPMTHRERIPSGK